MLRTAHSLEARSLCRPLSVALGGPLNRIKVGKASTQNGGKAAFEACCASVLLPHRGLALLLRRPAIPLTRQHHATHRGHVPSRQSAEKAQAPPAPEAALRAAERRKGSATTNCHPPEAARERITRPLTAARRQSTLPARLRARTTRGKAAIKAILRTVMAQPRYIPNKDADFATWLLNLSTLLTAAPATYGLTAPDAVIVAGVNTTFQAAYTAAIDPSTRTPVTITAKDAARAAAEATVRPYCVNVALNAAVAPEDKTALGVSLPRENPTPTPPPVTNPEVTLVQATSLQHTLSIRDVTTPTTKAKPPGVTGAEIHIALGTIAAVDPATARLKQITTKTPTRVDFNAEDRGKICTYFVRWTTRSGPQGIAQVGPWSPPTPYHIV